MLRQKSEPKSQLLGLMYRKHEQILLIIIPSVRWDELIIVWPPMLSGPDHFDELCDILEAHSQAIFLHLVSGSAFTSQFGGLKLSFSHFPSHLDRYAALLWVHYPDQLCDWPILAFRKSNDNTTICPSPLYPRPHGKWQWRELLLVTATDHWPLIGWAYASMWWHSSLFTPVIIPIVRMSAVPVGCYC